MSENETQDELDVPTFRIVVVAELAPRPDFRSSERGTVTPRQVDRASLDEAIAALVPPFALDVPDPQGASEPVRIDLHLRELRDFRPDALAKAVARVPARPGWARSATSTPQPPQSPRQEAAPVPTTPAEVSPSGSPLDSILDQVEIAVPPQKPAASAADPVSALVSAVARSARKPAVGAAPASPGGAESVAISARLLGELLVHPEFHRLEQLWRSVKLLVDHADRKRGVEVYLVAVDADEVDDALDAIAEAESGAFDLVVLGGVLVPTATSLEHAKRAATAGEAMQSAVLMSGSPELVGARDLVALGKTMRKLAAADDARATLVRAAASDEAMRWLFVALNGPWLRAPYDRATSRIREFALEQDATDPRSWLAALPAFALAALCAKSFAATAWPTPVVAPETMLEGLVVREATDAGHSAALAVEAFVSDDAARELAQAGFIAFSGVANRDSAYVRFARSMFRPAAAAPKDSEGSLADALFVGALVRALRELAAAIPPATPEEKIGGVAVAVVRDLMSMARPPGPEVTAHANGGKLHIVVRPHRFAGVSLEELALEIPLS